MSFACIYIPDFPLQAVVRNEPELCRAERGVVIVEGKGEVVMAANQAARDAGVRVGMIGLQVAHLPSLAIRPRSPAQEESAHAALLDLCFGFSPRVEDTAADALILDLEGLERAFGAPHEMAQQLRARAAELGLEAHVAIAPNPDAAWLAARSPRRPGITIIDSVHQPTEQCLGPLPVSILASSQEILETLNRWGIRTLAALAALPTEQLSERLGQAGVGLQQLARGASARALIPAQPSSRFEEAMELEYDEKQLDPLLFLLGRMLGNLCARLTARGLAASELRLRLELAPGEEQGVGNRELGVADKDKDKRLHPPLLPTPDSPFPSLSADCLLPSADYVFRFPVPMRDPRTLLKLLQLNLDAKPPSAPVRKISMAAEPAKPRAMQGGLFAPVAPDPEKLEITLARIKAIVGEENFGSAELPNTHRPAALRMARFDPDSEKQGVGSRELRVGAKGGVRGSGFGVRDPKPEPPLIPTPYSRLPHCSLRLFRPPLPAEVRTNSSGTPLRIFFRGMKGDVISAAGPWRTSGDWWTEEGWAQDEWDVEIERAGIRNWELGIREEALPNPQSLIPNSCLYRLYHDVASGEWFVRGCYD